MIVEDKHEQREIEDEYDNNNREEQNDSEKEGNNELDALEVKFDDPNI